MKHVFHSGLGRIVNTNQGLESALKKAANLLSGTPNFSYGTLEFCEIILKSFYSRLEYSELDIGHLIGPFVNTTHPSGNSISIGFKLNALHTTTALFSVNVDAKITLVYTTIRGVASYNPVSEPRVLDMRKAYDFHPKQPQHFEDIADKTLDLLFDCAALRVLDQGGTGKKLCSSCEYQLTCLSSVS